MILEPRLHLPSVFPVPAPGCAVLDVVGPQVNKVEAHVSAKLVQRDRGDVANDRLLPLMIAHGVARWHERPVDELIPIAL